MNEPFLFLYYPQLKKQIPHKQLGNFPTPITHLTKCTKLPHFYIKRDDLSGAVTKKGKLFGGNKVRKLKFLLPDAKKQNACAVITRGGAGSNHALATSVYAKQLGLDCLAVLDPQVNNSTVQRNLLLHGYYGTQLYDGSQITMDQVMQKQKQAGKNVYAIPVGGSNLYGVLGFIDAALELKEQIAQGIMPEPDKLYVAFGSMGTAAGLIMGLQLAGLKTKVIAISVTSREVYNEKNMKELIRATNDYLHSRDSSFPLLDVDSLNYTINYNFFGCGYGKSTPESLRAIQLLKKTENIELDQTYTGKAMAALLHDVKHKKIKPHEVVLFWNTYCADPCDDIISQVDYKKLPPAFQSYFQEQGK